MLKRLEIASTIAKDAGRILMKHYQKEVAVSYKHKKEPVTAADLESNIFITKKLEKAFPNDYILSEEAGGLNGGIDERTTWVIDPLDGTSNFLHGIPLFAVTIVLIEKREPVLGIIYDPVHNELITAMKGKGTKLNGKKIPTEKIKPKSSRHMFLAGRGHGGDATKRHGKIILALEKEMPYFRRLGSAASMLSAVATGRADGVILTGSETWDTAAGALMVQEAGGIVTDYCGKPWTIDSIDLVASRGVKHEIITDITKSIKDTKCD